MIVGGVGQAGVNCRGIAEEVLVNHFPEIEPISIGFFVFHMKNPEKIGFQVGRGSGVYSNVGWCVEGVIPTALMSDPNYKTVMRGFFGHEFAHIVNGDHYGLRGWTLSKLGGLPIVGERVVSKKEKDADITAITRGLGKELIAVDDYLTTHWKTERPKGYYTRAELRGLTARLSPKVSP